MSATESEPPDTATSRRVPGGHRSAAESFAALAGGGLTKNECRRADSNAGPALMDACSNRLSYSGGRSLDCIRLKHMGLGAPMDIRDERREDAESVQAVNLAALKRPSKPTSSTPCGIGPRRLFPSLRKTPGRSSRTSCSLRSR